MTTIEFQIESLKKQIEEMQIKLNGIENASKSENEDIPKIGDVYYYIDDTGYIHSSTYKMTIEDEDRIKIGNYFKTTEEVEFEVERLKVIAEMKKYAKKFVRGNANYFFCCGRDKKLDIEYWMDNTLYGLCFDKENIKKCIEKVGEERIKKYYLRVEDDE